MLSRHRHDPSTEPAPDASREAAPCPCEATTATRARRARGAPHSGDRLVLFELPCLKEHPPPTCLRRAEHGSRAQMRFIVVVRAVSRHLPHARVPKQSSAPLTLGATGAHCRVEVVPLECMSPSLLLVCRDIGRLVRVQGGLSPRRDARHAFEPRAPARRHRAPR